jgi:hypothetical protein
MIMTSIKQNIGPPADTVIVTSSGITAREPQQKPALVFSITLTQKRVRPPVWIILVLHAKLASVRALLSKAFITPTSHPLSNLCAMCLPCLNHCCMHTHSTQTKIRKCKCKFSRTHIDVARTHAHTHTHTRTRTRTRKHQHRNTCTRHLQSLDDDVLRHILQHHIWVCLIIPDSIERSHLICFTCSTLFLRLYWNAIETTFSHGMKLRTRRKGFLRATRPIDKFQMTTR